MVGKAKTKVYKVGSRHTIYLKKPLIDDSAFPFEVGESLVVRIEGDKLIIEKERKSV